MKIWRSLPGLLSLFLYFCYMPFSTWTFARHFPFIPQLANRWIFFPCFWGVLRTVQSNSGSTSQHIWFPELAHSARFIFFHLHILRPKRIELKTLHRVGIPWLSFVLNGHIGQLTRFINIYEIESVRFGNFVCILLVLKYGTLFFKLIIELLWCINICVLL
jgi:hypothetical protein